MNRVIIIARFENSIKSSKGRDSLESTFDEVSVKIADLYEQQNGAADIADIEKIYAAHGLRNDTGWEPELPILINGSDLLWSLPLGAYVEDAKNILLTLGAVSLAVHEQPASMEEWRSAPHPMTSPFEEDDIDDEDDVVFFDDEERMTQIFSRKPTIH